MKAWCLRLLGYICLFIRPKIQIVGSLSESLLFIKNINSSACYNAVCKGSLHVINSDTQKGNKS
jgi:hypothetical protein